jgi:hypothetical protein
MTNKADKKGPELLIVDTAMLQGVENLCNIAKKNRDNDLYNFLTTVKTALSKYPAIAVDIKETVEEARKLSDLLRKYADLAEQIFPLKTKELEDNKNS